MTSMENKSGYKKTKLGWIPDKWEVVSLKDSSKKKISYGIVQAGPHIEIGMPYIKSTDLNNEIKASQLQRTSDEIAAKYHRSEVVPGDIVFSLRGNIGVSQILPDDIKVANLTQGTARISVSETMNNVFVYYYLNSDIVKSRIYAVKKGSTFQEISLSELRKIRIAKPHLQEQQKIATILSTWDKAIDKLSTLIDAKEEQKTGLMQRLLTPTDSWGETTYGDILKEVKRNFDWSDKAKYDLISVRRRSGGLFFRDSLYGHQIKTKNLRTANEGDFLISKMQILHGASGLTTKKFDGMKISGSYIAVVSNDDKQLDIRYFEWLSKTKKFYHQTYVSSYGVHIEKMTFNFKLFKKMKLMLPSLKEQQKAISILNEANREIKILKEKMAELKIEKKGLMQQLLTGKTRVKIK